MTTNSGGGQSSETIDERIERLMVESGDGTSLDVIAGNNEEYSHDIFAY